MKRTPFSLALLLFLSACGAGQTALPTVATVTPTSPPTATPSPPPVRVTVMPEGASIGWCKIQGVVYVGSADAGNGLYSARVRCRHRIHGGAYVYHETITGTDGSFEFDVDVHVGDRITISTEKPGYEPAEYQLEGLDCSEACPTLHLVQTASSVSSRAVELVGHTYVRGSITSIFVQGDLVYLGLDSGLAVVDISDPVRPQQVSFVPLPTTTTLGWVRDLQVVDNRVYFLRPMTSTLRIIDVSDPTVPIEVGVFEKQSDPFYCVKVVGGYAYVLYGWRWYGDMVIVDISDPAAPTEVSHVEGGAWDVAVQGDYAYLVEENVRGVGRTDTDNPLRVLDISDLVTPREVGHCQMSPHRPTEIVVNDAHAYVATSDAALLVLDISDPTAPVVMGVSDTGFAYDIAGVVGNHVYVLARGLLRVIDVADPVHPTEVGFFDLLPFGDAAVGEGYVLAVGGDDPDVSVALGSLFVLRFTPPAAGEN